MDMAKVALCIIATQNYIDFVWPLLESADKYFLSEHDVYYHLFTDYSKPINIAHKIHKVKHEPWPAMTLKRFHFISSIDLSFYDYCYYVDADMRFVAPIGDEIFGELVGVMHPGYARGGGAWETDRASFAFVKKQRRKQYIAGGFQGGSRYWKMCEALAGYVQLDKMFGKVGTWHDESYWNKVYADYPELFTILPPSYCMTESPIKQRAWGIDNFEPKILALEKDHKNYQK
jgi:hypothetical protein